MALIKTAIDALEASELAAAGGGRAATAVMHDNEAIVDKMFRTLAAYVDRISAGVAAIILSSGFDITKEPIAREKATLSVIDGSNSGIVGLIAKLIDHAGSYIWMMKSPMINGVEQEYKIIGNSTQTKFEVSNFCVAGVTTTGTTDFCTPVPKMVI